MDYKVSQLKALNIANWDGIVMGGGVGISAHSPFIIATENTMYAMPEGKIGFFTDIAAGYFLSRLRNNIGYYLGLTGARLKGEDVYIAGLANFYISREDVKKAY
jgi:enoyl-CoA hydratase/carnithine racemase